MKHKIIWDDQFNFVHSVLGFVNQCQPRSRWSPPPMSCCSHSDSHKAERSSKDFSRLLWKSVSPSTIVSVWLCLVVMLSHFCLSRTECMNMIALPADPGDAGVITSPFYPSLLPRQCSCTWKFQVLHPIVSFFKCVEILSTVFLWQRDVFCWLLVCQMTSGPLGVALRFQNYTLKLKDSQNCEHGWWKVNEIM